MTQPTSHLDKAHLTNLADEIWKSAERLRGKFKAHEYQVVVLPIITIRRLECVLIKWREQKAEEIKSKRKTISDQELRKLVKSLELNPKQSPGFANSTTWTLRKIYEEDHTFGFIREAFLAHQVVFIRAQDLPPPRLLELAGHIGEIENPHPALAALPGHPEIMLVETDGGEGSGKYNTTWHTDVSFGERPPAASIMRAITLPALGGDTLFASQYAAYDNLSAPLKTLVEGLHAFHDGVVRFRSQLKDQNDPNEQERIRQLQLEYPGAVHPVVRRHPETGRKALYVNRSFTQRIIGLSEIESRNLLALLWDHAEQASFQVRWRWQEGDIAMLDNRCATHSAAMDYGSERRVMHRVTIKGDRPS